MSTDKPSLHVRSVNTWSRGPDYCGRLSRIAEKLHDDTPDGAGLIALQEVARPVRWPWSKTGEVVLAGRLAARYAAPISACRAGSTGIVTGPEWQLISRAGWLLGRDSWLKNLWSIPSRRYLLEAELWHIADARRLRFYATHLSHGDQESQRASQTERLISIVRSRALPGDLPPLLAGDFNAGDGSDIHAMLREHFELLHADRVDAIWAGLPASFPHARGAYTVEATAVIPLIAEGLCDAHDAPRVTLSGQMP